MNRIPNNKTFPALFSSNSSAGILRAGILFLATGCTALGVQASDKLGSGESMMPVTLRFAAEFAGKPFTCEAKYDGVGASDTSVTVSEYKLYVSNLRLTDASGNEFPVTLDDDGLWQQSSVGLLDFETGDGNCSNGTVPTNTQLSGTVQSGEYTGLAFDIGVPFEKNHVDPTLAASPMNLTSMFWNWRGGYRFLRVDLAAVNDAENSMNHDPEMADHKSGHMKDMEKGAAKTHGAGHKSSHGGGRGWSLHIGSTGCQSSSPAMSPTSCNAPNRIKVALNNFNPLENTLVIDPAAALKHSDVTRNTASTPPGCMSSPTDPECAAVFSQLGLAGSDGVQQLVRVR